ncbi:hypothetical protein [Streptomyces viridosporus]|uniref:hypothetical protein n=1 Tax=Streptomyces viridosporus TaxID=67581 RepID=UPI0036FA5DF5
MTAVVDDDGALVQTIRQEVWTKTVLEGMSLDGRSLTDQRMTVIETCQLSCGDGTHDDEHPLPRNPGPRKVIAAGERNAAASARTTSA